MAAGRNNLISRTVSGLIVVLGILGGIYRGGWVWILVVAMLGLLSLAEYYRLLSLLGQYRLSRGVGYISALAVILSSAEGVRPVSIALILALTVYAIFMIEMVRRQLWGVSFAIWNVGGTLSGLLFIIVPWTCMILLRDLPTGSLVLVSLFACTWSCDVTAYLVGVRWGKIKLCENISPKKTWEGFIGGVLGSVLMIAVIVFATEQPPFPLFLIGLICSFAGQLGDLAESLIKREAGAKDAGRLIPGHGGVLDRFDSILINGLLTYLIFGVLLL
ncbi:MAG: phosphatidate cytidylyltransferase [Synergistaceae bacterium]|jgi:phosphatidate cytidylyltransferase|nr:phosphatidate cytidylyltransferase [Synergistaceae bacterium]